MLRIRHAFLAAVLVVISLPAHAITYVVPSDRELVRAAHAVVIATAVESHAELDAAGRITTVTLLRVERSLKASPGGEIRLVEIGGSIGDRALIVPGSPRYQAGHKYLVFLHRVDDETWRTRDFQLGRFEIVADTSGEEYVARSSADPILGLDATTGAAYVERFRNAARFEKFIRATVAADGVPSNENYFVDRSELQLDRAAQFTPFAIIIANATRPDYLMTSNPRWEAGPTGSFGYCCAGNYPTAFGGNPINAQTAASGGVTAWNGLGSINQSFGAETAGKTGGLSISDGTNTILFNDPNNELTCCPSAVAIGGFWTQGTFSSLGDGATYSAIEEADIIANKNASVPTFVNQSLFTALFMHEVGHTLGFRHSDGTALNSSPPPACAAPSPCAAVGQAIMASVVPNTGPSALQQYDRDAAQTVYASASVCTNPSITTHPASVSINAGTSTSLTVVATGTSLSYQWYQGAAGVVTTPLGTAPTQRGTPTATAQYWVKVSACNTSVNSNVATVTVNTAQCANPSSVTITSTATTITSGQSVTLNAATVGGSGIAFEWLENGVVVGSGVQLQRSPTANSQYQARATGANCTAPILSNTIAVSVVPPPSGCATTISSATATPNPAVTGQPYTLAAAATTTSGTVAYAWFKGNLNDTANPIGNTATVNVPAGQTIASQNYWVRATSSCGSAGVDSRQVTVTVNVGTCTSTQLCLNGGRYQVTLRAAAANGTTTEGVPLYQSNVFGYFSLPAFTGDAANPEVFVKVVGPVNLVPWVFYAGLTNLDYAINVFDTQTGLSYHTYRVLPPPSGSTQNIGNFDVAGATSQKCSAVAITAAQTTAGGACTNDSSTLCLLNRFRVSLFAKDNPDRSQNSGPGTAVPSNSIFGFFTTPTLASDPNDIQAFVKMVDATSFDDFWVFLGGLTDFEFTVTVTDTVNGRQKIYNKAAGSTCGVNDTDAFRP